MTDHTEKPLAVRLLHAATTLNMLADSDSRRLQPLLLTDAPALIASIPILMTEAMNEILGKQALVRELMEAYTSAGGDGIASLGAICEAIRDGAKARELGQALLESRASDRAACENQDREHRLRRSAEERAQEAWDELSMAWVQLAAERKRADEAAMRESAADLELRTCKLAAEHALGATSDGPVSGIVELLATEHRNIGAAVRDLEAQRGCAQPSTAPENLAVLGTLMDGPDPAPVAVPPRLTPFRR